MLTQLEKLSKWDAQLKFLFQCRNHGVIPKGLRSHIPKNIAQSDYGGRLQMRFDRKILATSISDIYQEVQHYKKNSRIEDEIEGNIWTIGLFYRT